MATFFLQAIAIALTDSYTIIISTANFLEPAIKIVDSLKCLDHHLILK